MLWLKECGFGITPNTPPKGRLPCVAVDHLEAGTWADSIGRAVTVPGDTGWHLEKPSRLGGVQHMPRRSLEMLAGAGVFGKSQAAGDAQR